MSFANPWMEKLEKDGRIINSIIVNADRPEKMPKMQIFISDGGYGVKQIYHGFHQFKDLVGSIPDEIKIDPLKIKIVELNTDGGYKFVIHESKKMSILFDEKYRTSGFSERKALMKSAKEMGYDVCEVRSTPPIRRI